MADTDSTKEMIDDWIDIAAVRKLAKELSDPNWKPAEVTGPVQVAKTAEPSQEMALDALGESGDSDKARNSASHLLAEARRMADKSGVLSPLQAAVLAEAKPAAPKRATFTIVEEEENISFVEEAAATPPVATAPPVAAPNEADLAEDLGAIKPAFKQAIPLTPPPIKPAPTTQPALVIPKKSLVEPPAELPVEPAPPESDATSTLPTSSRRGSRELFLDRIQDFCDWLRAQTRGQGIFVCDRDGEVLYDEVRNASMIDAAGTLSRAAWYAYQQDPVVPTGKHVDLGDGHVLSVMTAQTKHGFLVLGVVLAAPLTGAQLKYASDTFRDAVNDEWKR